MRPLELLAPAKNLACGMAAIDHGADAVYIGAQRFGARAAAGNSVVDISELCRYAHQFGAKVYVTVNTIVYDAEIEDTRQLLSQLAQAQVDAILVQDMALLTLNPSLTLHASTQTDNRTARKVAWLRSLGFARVVLARELSIAEIEQIHREVPDVELEAFVHGALCVSYSGLCYASQACFGRSANRGECAQFCRMQFDLVDAEGRIIEHQRHLLSLKDMNQSDNLERLARAGVTSFKIEGRLKDEAYVKNVTARYSQLLNDLIARHPGEYCRSSRGRVELSFTPNLQKTFNRGYTTYFADGRMPDIASFDTPKALGEYVGYVKELRGHSFNVAGTAVFANGDGLCFLNADRRLEGFRVNRVEGNRIFPLSLPSSLRPGTRLYRNNDQQFERALSRPTARRKLPISMSLSAVSDGFQLTIVQEEADAQASASIQCQHQEAQSPQRDNIIRQLTKLGDTPFECSSVRLPADFSYFIPSSQLALLRRQAVQALIDSSASPHPSASKRQASVAPCPLPQDYSETFLYNISNSLSRRFYEQQGLRQADSAYELHRPAGPVPLMQCRHCLRYALGYCVKHGGRTPQWREPLCLQLSDGRRFRLQFDCRHCQMNVFLETGD
ncbi:MAG: U32 family peptidase [Prevotella sp.]|nr:U32 family peptidase [Prevotella sp.]